MKFISLTKYFYQHTQEEYETEYIRRLEAPFTVHFNIPIHQYNRKNGKRKIKECIEKARKL